MEQNTLAVESREIKGKGACRRIRRAGKVPGIVYGLGSTTQITVEPKVIEKLLLSEGGRNRIMNLTGSGAAGKAVMVKDYQVDPLSRQLLHVDLLEIDVTKKIQVTVPINIVGKSVGVAEGGVLNFIVRTIELKCLPTSIPQHIDVDVSALKIGASIHFEELVLPEGIERANAFNPTLVTVVPPTKEEEATAALAPTAEPEVITAKKPEEGEAAAAAGDKKDEKKK